MKKFLLFFLVMISMNLLAQDYPLVKISDIQFIDDVVNTGDIASPLNGDTLTIEGVVMVAPVVDFQTDRRTILRVGGRWSSYIQDVDGQPWGGMLVIQDSTQGVSGNTFWDLADTAQVVRITGVVTEYFTSTEFDILLDPVKPIEIIDQLPQRPAPVQLEMSDLMNNGVKNLEGEKYESMYVELNNLFTSDRNLSDGTFRLNNSNGDYLMMYDQSGFFSLRSTNRLTGITDYEPPVDGANIEYIRGALTTRDDGYYIVPLYPGDIKIGAAPPNISNVTRDNPVPAPNQDIVVSSTIIDFDGSVESAQLHYRVNGGALTTVNMALDTDDTYSATIPGISADSALVDYYLTATDNESKLSYSPVDTVTNKYFFFVLNRPLKISDVQMSPFGSGVSAFQGQEVTLQGVITADTTDLGNAVYMQDGSGPWTGIRLFGTEVLKLTKGELVEITGRVDENYDVTELDGIDDPSMVNSIGKAPVPDPVVLNTGTIGTLPNGTVSAEEYESVLLKYENITVTNYNADGSSNFGEMFVSDGSGDTRVELQDGNHKYHNLWDPLLIDDESLVFLDTGTKLDELTGVLYFSFGNYKLIPRNNDDFVLNTTDVSEQGIPAEYSLNQNYPNPFNPATTIEFSLPKESNVKLSVYNVLGQEVANLVNETKNAGSYRVNFDASKLASGLYFYAIDAGSFHSVKKMMLVK